MLSPAVPPSSTQPQMTLCFKMSLCAEAPQPRECGTGVHHAPHPRSRHGDCMCCVACHFMPWPVSPQPWPWAQADTSVCFLTVP